MSTAKSRIIYRGDCAKLTPRGKGKLSYEFGINDASGDIYIRIAGNSQGGTCSFEWITLKTIEDLLGEEKFSAVLFKKAFVSRSANNHGFLAAILKAEKVIGVAPEQPTKLTYLSFDSIKDQLNQLKKEGVDLPDLVAAGLKEREERKQQRKAPLEPVDKPKKKGSPKKTS
jgi:hypothetical protein